MEAVKRPEAAEARRLRAAELLAQGRSQAEVATAVGVSRESVRRWQARLAQGGVAALRRRRAGGRPPKLSDAQAAQVEQALRQDAKANGFATDLWTLDRVAQVVEHLTGVGLARASVWRLLVGPLRPRGKSAVDSDVVDAMGGHRLWRGAATPRPGR